MSEPDAAVYVESFERTGFTGGLNYYRNFDRNSELTEPLAERRIEQPAMFITGSRDPVRQWMPVEIWTAGSPICGRPWSWKERATWIQQERPAEVNEALLRFLAAIEY